MLLLTWVRVTSGYSTNALAAFHIDNGVPTLSERLEIFMARHSRSVFPRIPLAVWLFMMSIGAVASVIGYVGCFSLVQDSQSSTAGRYLWLGLEAALSLCRVLLWASNPESDDSAGIHINLDLSQDERFFIMTDKDLADLKENALIPVVEERDFLEDLVDYCGPISRVKADNTFFYYTIAGNRGGNQKLYIMLYDVRKSMTFAFCRDITSGQGLLLYHAQRELDVTQVRLGKAVPNGHRLRNDKYILDQLTSHYHSIVSVFNRIRDRHAVQFAITADWILRTKPKPPSPRAERLEISPTSLEKEYSRGNS
jgi:hypothetical protein